MARVCVFCASSLRLERRWLDLAREVGEALALGGHEVISGGGRVGLMGTLAEGARSAGGRTIGVIPQSLVDLEVADIAADELVITDGMAARKTIMIERSDVFVILPGGIGTMDELFEVWTVASLGLHDKPGIIFDAHGFFAGLLGWVDEVAAAGFISKKALALAGLPWRGHTDMLATLTNSRDVAMMFYSEKLRVVLATIHIALSAVPGALTVDALCTTLKLTAAAMPRFGFPLARIAVATGEPVRTSGG